MSLSCEAADGRKSSTFQCEATGCVPVCRRHRPTVRGSKFDAGSLLGVQGCSVAFLGIG